MASIARWGLIFTEMWLSLVERRVRDAEVAGSNPVISTIIASDLALRCGVAFLNECKEKMVGQTVILY